MSRQSGVDKLFSSNYVSYVSNYAVSGKEEFMYTGKSYDSATGLYYEGARYYDPTTGRFVTQDSVTGTQEDPMSLNRYMYARDNPMKIVDLAGHEWWNPVAAITSTISAVTTTVTSVASGVTNAWNSLPPSEQQAIEVTVVVAAASVAVVATAGLAAPVVAGALSYVGVAASASTVTGAIVSAGVGAAVSAGASLGAGLYLGNANPNAILSAATIGAASGGAGAVVGILGNAAIGAAATFADQQINSFATTGHWGAITPMSIAGDAVGGAIGAGGSLLGSGISEIGGPTWASNTARSALVTGMATTIASTGVQRFTPIPLDVGPTYPYWFR